MVLYSCRPTLADHARIATLAAVGEPLPVQLGSLKAQGFGFFPAAEHKVTNCNWEAQVSALEPYYILK